MSDTSVSPVEFGRVLGHLEAIQSELRDMKTRTIWRLDNLEDRVEKLETGSAARAPYWTMIERATPILLTLGLIAWVGSTIAGVV
ncbi:MAG: hypothetical protein RBS78_01035 [Coriobacteriia bacterium]|jgi:hypothetical protein|nr:hypothetical protein [Coriobacteriia bacterium]